MYMFVLLGIYHVIFVNYSLIHSFNSRTYISPNIIFMFTFMYHISELYVSNDLTQVQRICHSGAMNSNFIVQFILLSYFFMFLK